MPNTMHNKRQSASEYAYHILRNKITELELSPGMHLSEESLSADLEVSRTPLRQALYRLELEGLVVKQPNGRLHVASLTIAEADEIFKVREVLEGLLAREACYRIDIALLQRLEDVLELMRRAAEQGRKQDIISYGSDFHGILHSISDNLTAKNFLSQLSFRIERYRRVGGYKNPTYVSMNAVYEHQKIYEALKAGNADTTELMMRSHIRRSLETTIETLEHHLEDKS